MYWLLCACSDVVENSPTVSTMSEVPLDATPTSLYNQITSPITSTKHQPLTTRHSQLTTRMDIAVIERARNGDIAAFELIYEHFSAQLHRYVYRLVGNLELADDITQET